jgi:hypothetical protein
MRQRWGGLELEISLEKKLSRPPFQPIAGYDGAQLVIPAMLEA